MTTSRENQQIEDSSSLVGNDKALLPNASVQSTVCIKDEDLRDSSGSYSVFP